MKDDFWLGGGLREGECVYGGGRGGERWMYFPHLSGIHMLICGLQIYLDSHQC